MATYFITGTSRGIGLQLTASLASRPASEVSKVFAAARKQSDGLKKLIEGSDGRVQFVPLEITSPQSAKDAAQTAEESLNGKGLDVLINNAGIMNMTPNGIADMNDLSEHLNSNVVGAHNVTAALLPLIRKSNLKKVINITSTMGSLAMSSYFQENPTPGYNISKTALNMLTVQYAEAFRDEGITFVALCPGWVKTDMGGKDMADLTAEESIEGILEAADKIDAKDTGKFLTIRVPGWENHEKRYDGSVRPCAHAHVEIPEELEGSWPYTKADGFKHKTKLCRFYETGMKNMPAGELEGLGIAEIRARYESGRIPPHFRIQA